jgi:flavodoxin
MSKCLIAYYSRKGENYVGGGIIDLPVGNTEVAAEMVHAVTGGDLMQIETVDAYPRDYHETTEVARKELRHNARPGLRDLPDNIDRYDVVLLGFPNWWGTPPMAVFSFLEAYDFAGKTVVPFCTHEGSGLGRSESDIRRACPGAQVLGGLAITGGSVRGSAGAIRRWIDGTGLTFE